MSFTPTKLMLPFYPFKITIRNGQHYIFDELRKKHLVLTPEEWVRQHFIMYLISEKQFPKTLIQIESGLKLNSLQKRTDIVVFNKSGEKLMIIECKAPSIKINQAVFDQAARYNSVHKTPWIVVTNGIVHYYASIDHEKTQSTFIEDLPLFSNL